MTSWGFNPPRGFLASPTLLSTRLPLPSCAFQSAARILGFPNLIAVDRRSHIDIMFQSAARILGFPNARGVRARAYAYEVSIRRADSWLPQLGHTTDKAEDDSSFNPPRGFLASPTTTFSAALGCGKTNLIREPGTVLVAGNGFPSFYHSAQARFAH